MSPKKALRAAMLKRRFADTIFKATHQVEKCDPLRIQQERERLEREKQEAMLKRRFADTIFKATHQVEKCDPLKMQQERERLEKMEKTVEIYENVYILKDLEMLCYGSRVEGVHRGNPLERLGLYLKDDYLEEDEDAILDLEEGEILS
ncbi:hypothetical protein DH2020_042105 [Rehmannia glutinosa]|uniref:Uncharacterized protein n=1 Tax=Rehmannia glutinosa TaxID=99300 RepID=A0ABR0UP66_REHGL